MFLGVDIGTSAVKTVLINDQGISVATASAPLSVSRPEATWSEQDPSQWWSATNAAVLTLDAALRSKVQAIGLSGQMHGATVLGKDHLPLRPAILWNDGRSVAECDALQRAQPDFITYSANLVMPGFTAPKLAWLQRHEPSVFANTEMVLLPKDYVRFLMTGEFASDVSDSAGTLWMNVPERKWHAPLLEACGLDETQMPSLHEGHDVTGQLRGEVANVWGMASVPVMAGGGDNAAGAVGAGVINDGETLMSLGTSGVIFSACDSFRSKPASAVHSFCHAVPDRWHLMSVMLSAASCLEWARKATNTKSVADLIQLAASADSRSDEVFLPYLSGERTPHNDAGAKGVLFGVTHDTGPENVANAVLEGVAFGMADGFDALLSAGAEIETLSVIGGGAQSPYWGKILASVLDRPLIYRESATVGPAFGAARLAKFGIEGGDASDSFAPPDILSVVEPDSDISAILAPKRARFSKLYQTLKPTFAET